MDFGGEDELDFEEDLPEGESKNISEELENTKKDNVEDPDVNGCDQYLQIDCLEDEDDLLSKITSETDKPENTVNKIEPKVNVQDPVEKATEKIEKEEQEKSQLHENPKNNYFGKIDRKKEKERSFGIPLYRSPGSVRSNQWRPANNFMRPTTQNMGQRSNFLKGWPLRYPKLHHFSQNYLQNQNEFVSLLGVGATQNQNMQQMNNLFARCSTPILEVRKNFVRNGLLGQCYNAVLNQFQFNDFSRFKGALQPKLVAGANGTNFPVGCKNSFKTKYNRESNKKKQWDKKQIAEHVLPEGEKELFKSKKEARLIRFKNDEASKKEIKSAEDAPEKPVTETLNFEDEYFRKMEEQKRKREEIFSLKEKQNHCNEKSSFDKLAINKEFLLKKENPFVNCFKMAESNVKCEVKEEKWNERAAAKMNGNSLLQEVCFVKKEVQSPVKFVRTVSKSYEELGLNKSKSELFSEINDESDTCRGSDSQLKNFHKATLVDTASQTQTEPHLTGCIVKVLNVPPSTTANDILTLCTPFGIVREVKLNYPEDNSVAVRFAEPKSAENFFKFYNGRIIDSHTLNVITV